tara:strand:+ start:145 stop:1281 length:1137 start_codon:yes stop_codon:yes gene_type:complete
MPTMKLKVNSAELSKALSHIQGVVELRHTLPILSNVIIKADGDNLRLSSTNLDIFCSEKIGASIEVDGEISVPAITLHEIVKKLPQGSDIDLEIDESENSLNIKSGRSRFKLSTLPTDDFPDISQDDLLVKFIMNVDDLKNMIDKTKFAISNEESRYYLNGIFFHAAHKNGIDILRSVATDGHRLAQYDMPLPQGAEKMSGVIIPKKTILELRRILDDVNGDVHIALSASKIKFACSEVELVSKVIDGTFPDYTKVIPQNNEKKLKTNINDLKGAIERVSAIAVSEDTKSRGIKLIIENDKLQLLANSVSKGSAVEEIDVKFANDKLEIGFNSRYLLDIISEIDGSDVTLSFSDPAAPVLIEDDAHDHLFFVLMPMRI